jgi:hypothetical protein
MGRLLLLAMVAAVAAPSPAHATTCDAGTIQPGFDRLPIGCPLVVFEPAPAGVDPLRVVVQRGGELVDVAGPATTSAVELSLVLEVFDPCDLGHPLDRREQVVMATRHEIEIAGVEVGEALRFFGPSRSVAVVEAGPCPAVVVPSLYCGSTEPGGPSSCTDDGGDGGGDGGGGGGGDVGGCSAGGGGGLVLALAALALVRRKARYRSTMRWAIVGMLVGVVGCAAAEEMPWHGTWRESLQLPCGGGAEVAPAQAIEEVIFDPEGGLSVTWEPFETYVDYRGTHAFSPGDGTVELDVERVNYVPTDVDAAGTFAVEGGELVLRDMWLGSPKLGPQAANCGHRFTR